MENTLAKQAVARDEILAQPFDFEHHRIAVFHATRTLLQTHCVGTTRHEIVNHRQALGARVHNRSAGQQRPCVVILRIGKHFSRRSLLANFAVAHHHDVIGDIAYDREVMRDEQHAHIVLFLQSRDEIENLLLNRHVKRSGRLICDQQFRFTGNSHSDHHALLLSARHLVGKTVDLDSGLRNSDLREQRNRAITCGLAGQAHVLLEHLFNLIAHGEYRVQRAHRLLKNH